jgi:hypothetical protein
MGLISWVHFRLLFILKQRSTVEPVYNDISLYGTSPVESDSM